MHKYDTSISFISGVIGGFLFKLNPFLLNIHPPEPMITRLIESGLIAFVCGIAGVIGKEFYVWGKKKLKTKKKEK